MVTVPLPNYKNANDALVRLDEEADDIEEIEEATIEVKPADDCRRGAEEKTTDMNSIYSNIIPREYRNYRIL